jgi:hypothetical protein
MKAIEGKVFTASGISLPSFVEIQSTSSRRNAARLPKENPLGKLAALGALFLG